MVSIIIPVYNAEKTLEKCILSIMRQSYKNWELLLVDDGSTDASFFICDRFAACNTSIHVIHQENQGVSSARNTGLKKANGDWIAFVDADDYIDGDYFSVVEKNVNDLIIQQTFFFSDEQPPYHFQPIISGVISEAQLSSFYSKYLNYHIFLAPWGKIFRKEVVKDLSFTLGQKVGEDTLFNQQALSHIKNIEICSTGKYCYYDVSSHLKYELKVSEALQYLKRIYESYKEHGYENSTYLLLQLNFFTFVCRNDALGMATKWFNNFTVKDVFSECQREMTLIHRLKFKMSAIPGVFKFYHYITGKWV